MQDPARDASPVELKLRRIRGWIERGEYITALESAQALACAYPQNRDVIYSLAVSQRGLQRIPDALATLERLQRAHPRYSRLFQELGYCRAALRDAPGAIESFLLAVHLNPSLLGSWNMLVRLFMMSGDTAKMQTAAAHIASWAQLPTEIVTASSMIADDDLAPAEALLRAYLASNDEHVEATRLLAHIRLKRDRLDDAALLSEGAPSAPPTSYLKTYS
jgi:tetratricopeptide (TPR) repeat protein